MFMPSIADLILPVGAPPVRGPLYARFNQPAPERRAVRTIPRTLDQQFVGGLQGVSTGKDGDPCAVSINVFSKSTIQAGLEANIEAPFAGQDFELVLQLSD